MLWTQLLPKHYIYIDKSKSIWPLDGEADGIVLEKPSRSLQEWLHEQQPGR